MVRLSKNFFHIRAAAAERINSVLPGVPTLLRPITAEQMSRIVGKSNPTILEIGANDGTHTSWFLEIFPAAHIHCFEPDPRAIAKHRAKVISPQVSLHELALSDRDGEIEFHMSDGDEEHHPEGWDYSGSIRPPKEHTAIYPWVRFERKLLVKTQRLDAWSRSQDIPLIDFIWMDVQGAEGDVIAGGMDTLRRTRYIHMEYSTRELYEGQATLSQMLERMKDFKILARYKDDVLLANKYL